MNVSLEEMFARIAAVTLILLISGCGGGQEKSSDFIPDIPLECSSGQAADCAGNNLPVFVGIIESLAGADCDDFLTGMNATQRRTAFLAHGTATSSRAGILLTATITDWEDSLGGPIDVLTPGDYFVCAFVDTNSNGVIDTNEPVGAGTITAGQTGFILDDWTAAFN
jgi:hypothetical protein